MNAETPAKLNKQLYENSGLATLFAAENEKNGHSVPDPTDPLGLFFNQKTPNLAILHEKPEHRLMLYMKAQGASNRDIAQQCGYTDAWISQLFRQPWAQQRLLEIMNTSGRDKVVTLIEGAAADSVIKLIDLRDDPLTPKAVIKNVCSDLLDRFLGKPTQQVVVQQQGTPLDAESVDKQLAILEEEEKRLTGRLPALDSSTSGGEASAGNGGGGNGYGNNTN